MGYYSIFKIIRQILKDLFSYKVFKKIILIFLLTIITIFLLHNFGYCASDNPYIFHVPNEPSRYFDLTPAKDYYFIFGCYREQANVYRHRLIISTKPFTIRTNNSGDYGYINSNGGLWTESGGTQTFSGMQNYINTHSQPTSATTPNLRFF